MSLYVSLLLAIALTVCLPATAQQDKEKNVHLPPIPKRPPVQEQGRQQPVPETIYRQEWKNVPDSFVLSDAYYTPYDKAYVEALSKVSRFRKAPRKGEETVLEGYIHFDSEYLDYLTAMAERKPLTEEECSDQNLRCHVHIPYNCKAEYKNDTLTVEGPLAELKELDKQLRFKGAWGLRPLDNYQFTGAVPRKDAELYLYLHLSPDNVANLIEKVPDANGQIRKYRANVAKLVAKAQKNKDMELVITVDSSLSEGDLKKVFKLLKLRNPSYGKVKSRSAIHRQRRAAAGRVVAEPESGDEEEIEDEEESEDEDSDFSGSFAWHGPTLLTSLKLPHGTSVPLYSLPPVESEEDSMFMSEELPAPDKVNKFIDTYLKAIARNHKKYCVTTGPTHPDGSPLAAPGDATPAPAPAPTKKKKQGATRGFEKL